MKPYTPYLKSLVTVATLLLAVFITSVAYLGFCVSPLLGLLSLAAVSLWLLAAVVRVASEQKREEDLERVSPTGSEPDLAEANRKLSQALSDAISTYRQDAKRVLVTEERIETWKKILAESAIEEIQP
jgi:hypothetical protein